MITNRYEYTNRDLLANADSYIRTKFASIYKKY